jgi:uncharacterized protein involved in exopolysaccharide biosynthesis
MGQTLTLRDVVNLLFKHKYKILVIFFVVAVPAFVVSSRVPTQYMAKAVIMVNPGREFVPIPEIGDMRLPAPSQDAIINTEMELLSGRELSDRVIEKIGVPTLYPDLTGKHLPAGAEKDSAARAFARDLLVRNISRSNLIEVGFKHKDPQTAAAALTILVDALKDRHLKVFSNVKSSFLEEQLKTYEKNLRDSQLSLAHFRENHQILSEDAEGEILIRRRTEINTELVQTVSRLAELQHRLGFLKSKRDLYLTVGNSDLRSQLNQLRMKEQEAMQKYNDGAAVLVSIREDIGLVTRQLKEQEENLRNVEYLKIESEIGPLELRIAGLKEQIRKIDAQIQEFNKNSADVQNLKRQVASNESNYQIYLKKAEEARISEDMDRRKMTNITLVQKPMAPALADEQARSKLFGTGLLAAFVLAFGIAFAFEYIPQTFSAPDAAKRRLKVPLLAVIEHRT